MIKTSSPESHWLATTHHLLRPTPRSSDPLLGSHSGRFTSLSALNSSTAARPRPADLLHLRLQAANNQGKQPMTVSSPTPMQVASLASCTYILVSSHALGFENDGAELDSGDQPRCASRRRGQSTTDVAFLRRLYDPPCHRFVSLAQNTKRAQSASSKPRSSTRTCSQGPKFIYPPSKL